MDFDVIAKKLIDEWILECTSEATISTDPAYIARVMERGRLVRQMAQVLEPRLKDTLKAVYEQGRQSAGEGK